MGKNNIAKNFILYLIKMGYLAFLRTRRLVKDALEYLKTFYVRYFFLCNTVFTTVPLLLMAHLGYRFFFNEMEIEARKIRAIMAELRSLKISPFDSILFAKVYEAVNQLARTYRVQALANVRRRRRGMMIDYERRQNLTLHYIPLIKELPEFIYLYKKGKIRTGAVDLKAAFTYVDSRFMDNAKYILENLPKHFQIIIVQFYEGKPPYK